jgi:hypothetical protein
MCFETSWLGLFAGEKNGNGQTMSSGNGFPYTSVRERPENGKSELPAKTYRVDT